MTTDCPDEFQGSREGSVLSLDSSAVYITVGDEYLEFFEVYLIAIVPSSLIFGAELPKSIADN